MNLVMACNLIFMLWLGLAWKMDNWLNFSIKFFVILLALGNLFFVLKMSGYIVKAGS